MKPIHESSDVSEDHAFVALMSIANKHKLTYTSLTDIMKLISGLFPVPNVFLHSNLNQLNKYVNISEVVIKHSCCVSCMDLLAPGAVTATCERHECTITGNQGLKEASFYEISIEKQLNEHFKGTPY